MKISDGTIPGLKIVQLNVLSDVRGFFIERYRSDHFAEAGLPSHFEQDNHSRSAAGILRGLHYQHSPAQGKLIGVTRGRVWDVAVDIRPNSPTFGQHMAIEISDSNGVLFWIPAGFAHGFCVLGDEPVDMVYKMTALYNAPGEGGIAYDDPQLAIDWPVKAPIISERDRKQQSFAQYRDNPPQWGAL